MNTDLHSYTTCYLIATWNAKKNNNASIQLTQGKQSGCIAAAEERAIGWTWATFVFIVLAIILVVMLSLTFMSLVVVVLLISVVCRLIIVVVVLLLVAFLAVIVVAMLLLVALLEGMAVFLSYASFSVTAVVDIELLLVFAVMGSFVELLLSMPVGTTNVDVVWLLSVNVVVLLLSIGSTVVLSMAVIVVFVRFLLLSAIGLVTTFIVKLSSVTYASAVVTIVLTSVALKVIFAVLLSWTLFVFWASLWLTWSFGETLMWWAHTLNGAFEWTC